jgi:hypothetical protein
MGRRQALLRFAAGAVASLVAALVSELGGARMSGPLLALPVILLAGFTLIESDKGAEAACDDARGAVFGGVGMVAFAVVAAGLLGRMQTLNRALHTIAATRMRSCPTTQAYVARRTAEGKREIRRCLKRYIARQLYRTVAAAMIPQPRSADVLTADGALNTP